MISSPFAKPYIVPPIEHPRLMLKREDLSRVRRNLEAPECRLSAELWRSLLQKPVLCQGATPDYGTYNLSEYIAVEAMALQALLTEEKEDARKSIDALLFLLKNSDYDYTKGSMKARWSGHLIFVAAEVYDWCYAFLMDAEKQFIIATCEGYAKSYFEMGYPPEKQNPICGHGTEAQLLRDLLALGIAVYDERPDIYNFCAGRIIDEYVPTCDYMFSSGYHPQGPAYGAYRYTCLLWGALLLYSMSGEKVFSSRIEEMADSFFYLARPDGETLRLGDEFYEKKAPYTRNAPFAIPMFFAAAYTGNSRYYDTFEKGLDREYLVPTHCGLDYYIGGSYGEGLFSPTVHLIWNNLVPHVPSDSLPPYRYFGSPVGLTIWKDESRLVLMKIGELWGANHDHFDTGCFQIYCDGILASDSGVYDRYGTDHRKFYTISTGAHNCLTVFDPAKPNHDDIAPETPYDGGVRRPCRGQEPQSLDQWKREYQMATVLSHKESQTLCQIEGDLSEAYRHTCHKVIRNMCWEPQKGKKGMLTVHDLVDAKSDSFIAAFHLHCQSAPEVSGNVITISNEKAKLVCRVLQPEKPVIRAIGGEGQEFVVDGVNYDTPDKEKTEAGWGQVIITSKDSTAYTEFLVEMELQSNL